MITKKILRAVIFTVLFFTGCASDQHRVDKAFEEASKANLATEVIAGKLPIRTFFRSEKSSHAVIYLEGDGLVINKYGEAAINPAPTDPMALRLAAVDKRKISTVVINRPFHYIEGPKDQKYWTTARYSHEVIKSILDIIKTYQSKFGFETVEIVAYSGGAAVALLLSQHLHNITKIVSFAGNLDHNSWTKYHGTQPLFESLDPLKNKNILATIPQVHFVGESDDNTTVELALGYKKKINSDNIKIVVVPGFNHDSNWPKIWEDALCS